MLILALASHSYYLIVALSAAFTALGGFLKWVYDQYLKETKDREVAEDERSSRTLEEIRTPNQIATTTLKVVADASTQSIHSLTEQLERYERLIRESDQRIKSMSDQMDEAESKYMRRIRELQEQIDTRKSSRSTES